MPTPPIVDGKLYALRREGNLFTAAFYVPNGSGYKPEWRDVCDICFYELARKHDQFIEHMAVGAGGVIQYYSLDKMIAREDWPAFVGRKWGTPNPPNDYDESMDAASWRAQ